MYRRSIAVAAGACALVLPLSACEFTVDTTTNGSVTETTAPPVGEVPPVTIDGDLGLDTVLTVVAPEDADLASEAESGVYESAGALANGAPANSCKFVQTREVTVPEETVRAEVAVSDESLDEDQPDAAEPAADVVEDDPTTPETDLTVTLLPGDTFATQGCEDWVKVDDAPEGDE